MMFQHQIEKRFMIMINGKISLKSLLFITVSLEQLIGPNGSKAVLRTAGQRAAGNLIEMLPLTLSEEEAAHRTGPILAELGFIGGMQIPAPIPCRSPVIISLMNLMY